MINFKKICLLLLSLVCILTFVTSCGEDTDSGNNNQNNEDNSPTIDTVEELFGYFECFVFDPAVYDGYEFSHIQSVDGKETNSRTVVFSFSNAEGTKGFKSEVVKSLNPDPFGAEYIIEEATISFNGDVIKKNGTVTAELTLEDIVSLDLSGLDLSLVKNKLTNVIFENGKFSCKIPATYAGVIIGSVSGIDAVSVSVEFSDDQTKLSEIIVSYSRDGIETISKITFD